MLDAHRRHVADATVAVLPVSAEQTAGFGILKVNRQGRIVHFEEKPKPERLARARVRDPGLRQGLPGLDGHLHVLARGARARDLGPGARGLRPPRDPEGDRRPARAGALLPRLLGGRRHDPLVLRGQPAAVRPDAALRLLRRGAAGLHPPALPARDQGRGLRAQEHARLRGRDPDGSRDRALGGRHPQPHRPGHADPPQPDPGRRLLREPRRDRPRPGQRPAAGRDRPGVRDRARDRRQERARRPRRAHRQRGGRHARRTATATSSATGS